MNRLGLLFGWLPELDLPDWVGTAVKITVFAVAAFFATRSRTQTSSSPPQEETSDAQAASEDEAGPHTEAIAEDEDTSGTPPPVPPRSTPAGIG